MLRAEETKRKKQAQIDAKRAEEARLKSEQIAADKAQEAKRLKAIEQANELKQKAEADLAAAAAAKAEADAEVAMQESSQRVRAGKESVESHEMIEAALMGADSDSEPQQDTKPSYLKTRGFAVKYDVVIINGSNNDIDVPQLLEGSLKDLLKEDGGRRDRRTGDNNY
jgi:hypothetical protein